MNNSDTLFDMKLNWNKIFNIKIFRIIFNKTNINII